MRYWGLIAFLFFFACSGSGPEVVKPDEPTIPSADIRLMCYNVHWCTGVNGQLSVDNIIDVIRRADPDVVAVNEIDRNYDARSNYEDQLQIIADALDMEYHFQKTTWKAPTAASGHKPREFGHAILSKEPIEFLNARLFDVYGTHYRGVLETRIVLGGKPISFYVTHLDTDPVALNSQAVQLRQWMDESDGIKVLMGDMNAVPDDNVMKYIMNGMTDAFALQPNAFTFKSNNPSVRIDYILGSGNIEFRQSEVVKTFASDHFPIVTEMVFID